MKHSKKIASGALLSLLGLMQAPFVYAVSSSDGRVSFVGGLTTDTCTISVQGSGNASSVIDLPRIGKTGLNGHQGNTQGEVSFKVQLLSCSHRSATNARIYFEGGTNVDENGLLRNSATTGAAQGVALLLMDVNNAPIKAGDPSQLNEPLVPIGNLMRYSAEYIATSDTVTAGKFLTRVTYSIDYE